MSKFKYILSGIIGRFNMFIGMIKDVKFCPNCKVRMSIIYKDWNRIYITRECPCCKSTLMTPYGTSDYDEDDLLTEYVPEPVPTVSEEVKDAIEKVNAEVVE